MRRSYYWPVVLTSSSIFVCWGIFYVVDAIIPGKYSSDMMTITQLDYANTHTDVTLVPKAETMFYLAGGRVLSDDEEKVTVIVPVRCNIGTSCRVDVVADKMGRMRIHGAWPKVVLRLEDVELPLHARR